MRAHLDILFGEGRRHDHAPSSPLALVALLALAGLQTADKAAFQGWVEADFIFVGPDEAGRSKRSRCARATP